MLETLGFPVENLFKLLKTDTDKIVVHDPYVEMWEEMKIVIEPDLHEVFKIAPDLIVISTAHSFYKSGDLISKILNLPKCKIFDSVGLFNEDQIKKLSMYHNVSIIGRGNTI